MRLRAKPLPGTPVGLFRHPRLIMQPDPSPVRSESARELAKTFHNRHTRHADLHLCRTTVTASRSKRPGVLLHTRKVAGSIPAGTTRRLRRSTVPMHLSV